jgi:hypothetical protein
MDEGVTGKNGAGGRKAVDKKDTKFWKETKGEKNRPIFLIEYTRWYIQYYI